MLLFLSLFSSDVQAVPLQVTQQGRILDSSGASISGSQMVVFRVYDDPQAGNMLWEEMQTVIFTNGYYAAVLGADEQNNPLDSDTLSLYPLYLELQLDANAPMTPRHALNSTPYAQMAGVAQSVDGGAVNASEVSVGLTPVIDSGGYWVGPSITVDWSSVTNIPSDLADGDNDTQLSEVEVETMVTNDALDLAGGSTMAGSPILTAADAITPDWTDVTNRPPGLDDGDDDTQLTEAEVEGMITNGALNLDGGTTVGGKAVLTQPDSCDDGQILVYSLSTASWACGADTDNTLTSAEVQAMVEAMTLNLQNTPQVNGSDVLTASSSVEVTMLDVSNSTDGQILMSTGSEAQWSTPSSGCQGTTISMGERIYNLMDCGDGNALLATDYGAQIPLNKLGESTFNTIHFFCGIRNNGKAHCWGDDMYNVVSDTPKDKDFTDISLGGYHACAREDLTRSVSCWGYDNYGTVSGVPSGPFIQLSSGRHFTCGIYANYTNLCWGDDSNGVVSQAPSTTFAKIKAGRDHICGITSDGTVECWGNDSHGQVSQTPAGTFTDVFCGGNHNCALQSDGNAVCWGDDSFGQVSDIPSTSFTSLESGPAHICGISSDGTTECWGSNSRGESDDVPPDLFESLTLSYDFSCGITTDKAVKCWGKSNVLSETPAGGSYSNIVSNYSNACAQLEKGNVVCWYGNYLGQNMP